MNKLRSIQYIIEYVSQIDTSENLKTQQILFTSCSKTDVNINDPKVGSLDVENKKMNHKILPCSYFTVKRAKHSSIINAKTF